LFTVELLEREQIEPFESEEEAIATLQAILNDIKSVKQWHLQVRAVTSDPHISRVVKWLYSYRYLRSSSWSHEHHRHPKPPTNDLHALPG
jgi:hypothetical protein